MREAQQITKDAQWKRDTEATHCSSCEKEFSISRRRVCSSFFLIDVAMIYLLTSKFFIIVGHHNYDKVCRY